MSGMDVPGFGAHAMGSLACGISVGILAPMLAELRCGDLVVISSTAARTDFGPAAVGDCSKIVSKYKVLPK